MIIVKHLRREKQILTTMMETLTSDAAKLKSKLEFANRDLAEARYNFDDSFFYIYFRNKNCWSKNLLCCKVVTKCNCFNL